MNFGQAIEAMKSGKSIQRAGWNGKGMHVYLEDGWVETLPNVKAAGVFRGTTRSYAPYLVLYTSQGVHQPGWNASTPDVLADDWQIAVHE
jgi:hypothetical protein